MENLIMPSRCAACVRSGSVFCPACRAHIPRLEPRCPLCGQISRLGLFCSNCRPTAEKYQFDGILAYGLYEKTALKPAIRALKYQGVRAIGPMLGKMLGRQLLSQWQQGQDKIKTNGEEPLIIPVPLHPRRQRERGYNQALLIAQGVATMTAWPLASGLKRLSYQAPSAKMTYSARLKQKKYFLYQGPDLSGRTIILIDDIFTTGATAQAAAGVLKQAGARYVIVAVAAQSG